MHRPLFLSVALGLSVMSLQGAEPTWFRIHNRWYPNESLGEDQGKAVCREAQGDAYLWRTETKDGQTHLLNKATGHALQADAGVSTCATADHRNAAQAWTLETISGPWVGLRANAPNANGWLNIEHRRGGPESDMTAKPTDQDRWSGQWEMLYVSGARPVVAGRISVTSPGYGGDIAGVTTVELAAPGLNQIAVSGWSGGRQVNLPAVTLDAEGRGSFRLDPTPFPRGPFTLKLQGSADTAKDICYLQLYHTGGKARVADTLVPPGTEGMKLVFADEFDKPLSISRDGKGATYAAHKPGGGDFSGIPFSDFEGASNPFSQRDGFLRIRADEAKNSTGLLSSLRMDGTGFTAKAPCYFECRFIAQTAPGTWPAFWLMTADTWKGMKTPVDELDVIEAYGGEGPGQPNAPGYEITSHYWNQGPDGAKDQSQPGIHKQVLPPPVPGLSGTSWYEDFHTYGVKVGLDQTIYYRDGAEVGRHPTAKLSREQPFFFFINLAIGGTSGWKKDLSRYGGIADMYVDFVKVYQGGK